MLKWQRKEEKEAKEDENEDEDVDSLLLDFLSRLPTMEKENLLRSLKTKFSRRRMSIAEIREAVDPSTIRGAAAQRGRRDSVDILCQLQGFTASFASSLEKQESRSRRDSFDFQNSRRNSSDRNSRKNSKDRRNSAGDTSSVDTSPIRLRTSFLADPACSTSDDEEMISPPPQRKTRRDSLHPVFVEQTKDNYNGDEERRLSLKFQTVEEDVYELNPDKVVEAQKRNGLERAGELTVSDENITLKDLLAMIDEFNEAASVEEEEGGAANKDSLHKKMAAVGRVVKRHRENTSDNSQAEAKEDAEVDDDEMEDPGSDLSTQVKLRQDSCFKSRKDKVMSIIDESLEDKLLTDEEITTESLEDKLLTTDEEITTESLEDKLLTDEDITSESLEDKLLTTDEELTDRQKQESVGEHEEDLVAIANNMVLNESKISFLDQPETCLSFNPVEIPSAIDQSSASHLEKEGSLMSDEENCEKILVEDLTSDQERTGFDRLKDLYVKPHIQTWLNDSDEDCLNGGLPHGDLSEVPDVVKNASQAHRARRTGWTARLIGNGYFACKIF